jgi:hypothetical protein
MVVATPKPRLVKVAISPHGEEPFSLVGSHRKAMRFLLKFSDDEFFNTHVCSHQS